MRERFENRRQAGRELAVELESYRGDPDLLVLGLPRGGVPVAYEVASKLKAPLDIFLVRKLGVPGWEELALGAIASGGVRVLNDDIVDSLHLSSQALEALVADEERELRRRERAYGQQAAPVLEGRSLILVDDGLATGASMRVAVRAVRKKRPKEVVVAVPVAAPDTCEKLGREVDAIHCLYQPYPFRAVGLWYEEFPQTSDDEVRALLRSAAHFSSYSSEK